MSIEENERLLQENKTLKDRVLSLELQLEQERLKVSELQRFKDICRTFARP